MVMSPTARTLAYCKKKGIMAGVVERWIPIPNHPAGGIRKDLFGFIDLIAIPHGKSNVGGTVAIQATSTANMSARFHKATEECAEALTEWLYAMNTFEIWGWAKRGKVGKRKLWTLRRVEVKLEDDGRFSQLELEA